MKRVKRKNGATFKVILEPSKDGGYAVHVPALLGCHTQGETVEEDLVNARDAIRTYLLTAKTVAERSGGSMSIRS